MPELLIITDSKFSGKDFLQIAERKGFTVRSTNIVSEAVSILNTGTVDAVLAPITVDSFTQQGFLTVLWTKSPNAPFMLYAQHGTKLDLISTAKVYGAEVLFGELASAKFKSLLDSTQMGPASMSVMIIEDLDTTRDIISMYVEGVGDYTVGGFSSAVDALKELKKNPEKFSCVLTDINMPKIDGKEFLSTVRSDPKLKHLPVIVLTAYGTMNTLIECLKLGATGFLAKPPKKADLLRELSRANRVHQGLAEPRLATDMEAEALRKVLIEGWSAYD